jgi:hypothetical protein
VVSSLSLTGAADRVRGCLVAAKDPTAEVSILEEEEADVSIALLYPSGGVEYPSSPD